MPSMLSRLICGFFLLIPATLYAAETSKPVSAVHGMVVSDQHLATDVGVSILKSGGNAIDAAVAVGYALAVVNPCCGNIGGGGFMLIRFKHGKPVFINFRERAPLAATANMLNNPEKASPYLEVAVPGTVLGLETALKKYGTLTRQQVMAPAIALAEKGFVLTPGDDKYLSHYGDKFKTQPNVAAIFLKKDLQPYNIGDRLVQTDLAKTLKLISSKGTRGFYEGSIAKEVVAASEANGGILTMKDFASYYVDIQTPINCTYHGYHVISAPPPSSGGVTLCEILNILEHYPLKKFGFHSPQSVHAITEAMRFSFYDRNNALGDPDFIQNPVNHLISKTYATTIANRIQPDKVTPSSEIAAVQIPKEKTNTTHYSVIDKDGNAVSVTYSLNGAFGGKIIAGDTGFFLNNQMDDFTSAPGKPNQYGLVQGNKNAIQPGKRPLSSMTPTIITYHNKLFMVVGSPGGPRIITSTLQTILNVMDYGMTIQEAVDAPRFHHQFLPDEIEIEANVFSDETMKSLTQMGYQFKTHEPWGAVEAIYIDPATKKLYGGSDQRRRAGSAAGY